MTDQLDQRITAALRARADIVATSFEQRPFVAPSRRRRPTRSFAPRHAGGGTWRWLVPAGVVSAAIIALVLVFLGGGQHAPHQAPAGGSGSSAPSRAPSVSTSAATSPASSAAPTSSSSSMPSSSGTSSSANPSSSSSSPSTSSVPGTRTTTLGPGYRGNAHSISGGRASH